MRLTRPHPAHAFLEFPMFHSSLRLSRSGRPPRVLIVALLAASVAAVSLSPGAARAAVLVSAGAGGSSGNGASGEGAITPNGRYVAFVTTARNLIANDLNLSAGDVILRDVRDGVTTLVSVNRFGTGTGNGASHDPSVSENGRWVVFTSAAEDLVGNDANGVEDVFVRDLTLGTTLVSVRQDGSGSATGASGSASISSNGRWVSFSSVAEDLVASDGNGQEDVFVRDLQTGMTTLVSIDRQGSSSGTGRSFGPVLTPGGRTVAFVSNANDLVADDENAANDVFLRDLNAGTTTIVSISRDGTGGGKGDSWGPIVSPNGRYVAFTSVARDMVTADRNHSSDVFLRDLRQGTTTLVSVSKSGKRTANGASVALAVASSGRYVLFTSRAPNLGGGDRNETDDVFLRDLRDGVTQIVSVNANGRSANGPSSAGTLSSDGRYALFASTATDLVQTPVGGLGDVYRRDVADGVTTLASAAAAGSAGGNGPSDTPLLTPDGRFGLFLSTGDDLAEGDANGALADLFRAAF
jgi:Tol biopolymer transport system component